MFTPFRPELHPASPLDTGEHFRSPLGACCAGVPAAFVLLPFSENGPTDKNPSQEAAFLPRTAHPSSPLCVLGLPLKEHPEVKASLEI